MKKAYPGTISSVVLSVLVMMIMLVPLYTANNLEGVRNGEDKYEFKEVMCFDIDDVEQFMNIRNYPHPLYGTGAFEYTYKYHYPYNGFYPIRNVQQMITLDDAPPIEGTVDGYGRTTTMLYPGQPASEDEEQLVEGYGGLAIYTTMTNEILIEKDVTRIDIYFDATGRDLGFSEVLIELFGRKDVVGGRWDTFEPSSKSITLGNMEFGSVGKFEISVDDLLLINTWEADSTIIIRIRYVDEGDLFLPGCDIVFDMQFYNLEGIKITSIDWIAIAMAGGGMFMLFCSVIMLPHVTFSGVIGRIVGKRS